MRETEGFIMGRILPNGQKGSFYTIYKGKNQSNPA
jgi:hypothetical protein